MNLHDLIRDYGNARAALDRLDCTSGPDEEIEALGAMADRLFQAIMVFDPTTKAERDSKFQFASDHLMQLAESDLSRKLVLCLVEVYSQPSAAHMAEIHGKQDTARAPVSVSTA